MPLCLLTTSLKDSDIPAGLEVDLAALVAKVLGKPIERMSVTITPGLRMYRFQETGPGCLLQIHSIGVFDAQRNPAYGPPIIDFLSSKLKLPPQRVVVQFLPLDLDYIAQVTPN